MKFKRGIVILTIIANVFTIGCSRIEKSLKNIKSFNEKQNNNVQEKPNNIADGIEINISSISIEKDYENNDVLLLKVSLHNLDKNTKLIDSEDITLTQDGVKLKYVYDENLKTEAFYEEIKGYGEKSYTLGYKIDNIKNKSEIKLKYTPYLSKDKIELPIDIKND